MCGIAGQHGEVDPEEGARMLARLVHRGPDDEGSASVADAWLGQRRLSIVDLESGHQPLASADGSVMLVGNGEVYNHERLRMGLADQSLLTRSDNEVALRLVQERGPRSLCKLHGMYAFLIAGSDGSFLAARDPVGIKPLYWARGEDGVRFASEMRAFDASWQPLVEAFPPGHYWTPEGGLERFASAVPPVSHLGAVTPANDRIPDEVLVGVRELLCETVERQLMGDVPVGGVPLGRP